MTRDPFGPLPRRHFIKTIALFSASSWLSGAPWSTGLAAELQPLPDPDVGLLHLHLPDYPALAQDQGSVRLGTSGIRANRAVGLFPPMLINRVNASQYIALSAACTHDACILPPLNATSRLSVCPCHGSRFNIEGKPQSGSLARQPLTRYETTLVADRLTVAIPDMDFTVTAARVPAASPRLALDFLSFSDLQYEVRARASLDALWEVTSFALTADGPLNQTVFPGKDDFTRLYVPADGPAAFYAVTVRARVV